MLCNIYILYNTMDLSPFLERLRDLLPEDWQVTLSARTRREGDRRTDATLQIRLPRGPAVTLAVEAKARLSAQMAAAIASAPRASEGGSRVVLARYLSPMARVRLRDAGLSYLDLTGNTWINLARPYVLIDRQGAETDPDPPKRGLRSLKGAKAGRIIRALCDNRPPVGVRDLARRTGTDPGYATRVLRLLEEEDLVSRGDAAEVVAVRWPEMLRRWSLDYTTRSTSYLAPRGLSDLERRLAMYAQPYAVTGLRAVPKAAQVLPAHLLSLYVLGAESAAKALDLRAAAGGANVMLLEPVDEFVFTGAQDSGGLRVVAASQCAVDLLTGRGRDPSQADALIDWMRANEDAWRA